MDSGRLASRITAAIDGARDEILDVSRRVHERPELGKEEAFASGLLADALERHGFAVERGYAGLPTAFLARKGGGAGPRVAFMAEYDALPGIGHGCGHNLIGASALAAGIGLGAVAAELGGEARVYGTPAEETDGAKVGMAAAGCFDDVDAALMVHPYDGDYYVTESLAMDALEVRFYGKPAHAAASPWEGLNALDAVILLFSSLNALRQQMRPDARLHGIIREGGTAPNVIPEKTVARFYIRARRRDYLDVLVARFRDCAAAAALATGTHCELSNYEASFDDMANSLVLAERVRDRMPEPGRFGRSPDGFGSLDMGNVSHVVPAAHVLVGITGGKPMALHTPEFRDAAVTPFAEARLLEAGKALALTGLDLLSDPALLSAARDEFRAGLGYEPGRSS